MTVQPQIKMVRHSKENNKLTFKAVKSSLNPNNLIIYQISIFKITRHFSVAAAETSLEFSLSKK